MKIIALTAENIKRLVAVEIRPDGNMVQITGRNGQGKTSVLDSLWWAIAGAKNIQDAPIRRGATEARIRLDLGEVKVTRTFTAKPDGEYTTRLQVEGGKGTPQAMLDSLMGALAFDPLAFARAAAPEQYAIMRGFVTAVDWQKLDDDNARDYEERTAQNKRATEARTMAGKIPATQAERVDTAALVQQLADAGRHNADITIRQDKRKTVAGKIETNTREIEALTAKLETLEAETSDLRRRLEIAPPLPAPVDTAAIQAALAAAEQTNEAFRQQQRREDFEKAATAAEAKAKALTAAMQERTAGANAAIEAAKLPIAGLGLADVVTLNGVPFSQASDAEQLRASIAIAMAGNPALRVIRVRDGSLLDTDSMKILSDMADAQDYQVWIERVDGSGTVGFVIEDGMLKGAAVAETVTTAEDIL